MLDLSNFRIFFSFTKQFCTLNLAKKLIEKKMYIRCRKFFKNDNLAKLTTEAKLKIFFLKEI